MQQASFGEFGKNENPRKSCQLTGDCSTNGSMYQGILYKLVPRGHHERENMNTETLSGVRSSWPQWGPKGLCVKDPDSSRTSWEGPETQGLGNPRDMPLRLNSCPWSCPCLSPLRLWPGEVKRTFKNMLNQYVNDNAMMLMGTYICKDWLPWKDIFKLEEKTR